MISPIIDKRLYLSIWLPLREYLLSPKRTLIQFFQIFLRLPLLLYTNIELLGFQERLFRIIFCYDNESQKKNVKTYLYVKKSQLFEKNTIFPIAM